MVALVKERPGRDQAGNASPDNEYVLGTVGQTATLYEIKSGEPVKDFQFNTGITHPDWSPDNTAILMVRMLSNIDGQGFSIRKPFTFLR